MLQYAYNASGPSLLFIFSKAVNVSSFDASKLTLQNDHTTTPITLAVTVDGAMVSASADLRQLTFFLSSKDSHAIQPNAELARSINTTYISITSGLVQDLVGLSVVAIPSSDALQAKSYAVDIIAPRVVAFDIDLTLQFIRLSLSKIVNVSSFVPQANIVLQSSATTSIIQFSFSDGTHNISQDKLNVTLFFTSSEFNTIMATAGLAKKGVISTFLSLSQAAFSDHVGNPVVAIPNSQALLVRDFKDDVRAPVLLSFGIDIQTGVLHLTFNEPVQPSSLIASKLKIQSSFSSGLANVSLAAANVSVSISTFVNVTLTSDVLNDIQTNTALCRLLSNTFLVGAAGFVKDVFDNSIVATVTPLQATFVSVDDKGPALVAFNYDNQDGILVLTFSEVVNRSSFNVTSVSLHSAASAGLVVSLHGALFQSNGSGLTVFIQLLIADLEAISQNFPLARSNDTTFISLSGYVVRDMFGNPLTVLGSSSLQVYALNLDKIAPTLQSFTFILNSSSIILTFSKPINISTIRPVSFVLLAANSSSIAVNYTLTSNSTVAGSSNGGLIQIINVGLIDSNAIKALSPLCSSLDTTFLVIKSDALKDMYGNSIVATNAVLAAAYVQDANQPALVKFGLNMNDGTLTLEFSMTVNISSLDVGSIKLQNTPAETLATKTVQVISKVVVNGALPSAIIILQLSQNELNSIKATAYNTSSGGIGASQSSTYLYLNVSTVYSMARVTNVAILNNAAQQVSNLVTDNTAPKLDTWRIDLDAGMLFINFTEFINASSLTINKIKLQNSSISNSSFALSSSTISSLGAISEAVVINLSADDWLQAESTLSITASFMILDSGTIRDQAVLANPLILMPVGQQAVSVIVHVEPRLNGFELDLSIAVITLKFSRPMLAYADTSKITVKSLTGSSNCTLTGGSVLTANNTDTMRIQMNFADRACIKLDPSVGKSLETTAIAVKAAAFKDYTLVFESSAAGTVNASSYTPDAPIDNSTTLNCINSFTTSESVVRLGQTVLCTIVPKYLNIIQPVFLANFLDVQVSNPSYQIIKALTASNSGAEIEFEVVAPVVDPVGSQTLQIRVQKFDLSVLASDVLLIVGSESFQYSRQSCVGPQGIVNEARFGDTLSCTIVIRGRVNGSNDVATTGLSSDFNVPKNNSAQAGTSVFSSLQSSSNYSLVTFTVRSIIGGNLQCSINFCVAFQNPIAYCYFNALACKGQGITITGSIPNIATGLSMIFLQNAVSINIRGTPSIKSVLDCFDQGRLDKNIRLGSVVVCTIFAYDSSGIYPTTGFVTDFIAPIVKSLSGTVLSATGMSAITEFPSTVTDYRKGKQMQVSFIVPTGLMSNDTIKVQGRLADGTIFSTDGVLLTFVGTPTSASTVSCIGTQTLQSVVHVSEIVTCFIDLKDNSSTSCTGYPEDFSPVPDIGSGTDLTSIAVFTTDATVDNKLFFHSRHPV